MATADLYRDLLMGSAAWNQQQVDMTCMRSYSCSAMHSEILLLLYAARRSRIMHDLETRDVVISYI